MREALFIKRNAEKWQKYQQDETTNPDETAERFITLVDDLSYAKTFYPRSKVTRWINGIAAGIYQNIYRNKKEKYTRIFTFWKFELPLLFKRHQKVLLFTFTLFSLFTLIGILGSANDPEFMRNILGAGYVEMTEENIAKGDPFGVYKESSPFTMFVVIAMNNIGIALLMVIGGLFLGIPTLFRWPILKVSGLWDTGLMLGSFQYLFYKHNLGMESILVIWIHGTLEILSIVISATAGFIITSSYLFPGTYSRIDSFKKGMKDAMKVMIVLVPVFIMAAFLETYVTHLMSQHYDKERNVGLPVWVSILILSASLIFIIWYFVILPIRLHKKGYRLQPDGIIHRLKEEHA